jgi:hypothetical protein
VPHLQEPTVSLFDDDPALEMHTAALPVGRVRPATLDESEKRELFFRADAVIALRAPLPADTTPFEQHVAGFIDGFRPVARVRKKSGLQAADLRIALAALYDRGLLTLTGLVEPTTQKTTPLRVNEEDSRVTSDGVEVIPPHVMAEIEAMLEEEEAQAELQGLKHIDDATDAIKLK